MAFIKDFKDFLLMIFGGYKGIVVTQINLYNLAKRVAPPELSEDDLLNELIVSRIKTMLRPAAREKEYIHYRPLLENPHKTLKDVIRAIVEYEVPRVRRNVDKLLEVENYIEESIEKKVKKTEKATTGRPLYITKNLEKPFKAGQITQTLVCGADLADFKWATGQIVDIRTEKQKILGRVKITSVELVTIEELTPRDAEMEGFSSVDELKHMEAYFLHFVEKPQTGELYRISFESLEDTQ